MPSVFDSDASFPLRPEGVFSHLFSQEWGTSRRHSPKNMGSALKTLGMLFGTPVANSDIEIGLYGLNQVYLKLWHQGQVVKLRLGTITGVAE